MTEKWEDELSKSIAKTAKYLPQFLEFVDAQNELLRSGACLLTGTSYQEDYEQFLRLVKHVENLWDASVALYRAKCFPQATFLAITTMEETGKIGVARFQIAIRDALRSNGSQVPGTHEVSRRRNPFYSHSHKHLLAAGAGAIVNNRLDRLVGRDRVCAFLDRIKAGDVEALRQACLYADLAEGGPLLPADRVGAADTLFYVIVAGELMAEVLGFEPTQWERLLNNVQEFERMEGEPWE